MFAVQRTQCQLVPEKSRYLQKKDKMVIILGKVSSKDNWFSLHKQKCVG